MFLCGIGKYRIFNYLNLRRVAVIVHLFTCCLQVCVCLKSIEWGPHESLVEMFVCVCI